MEEKKENTSKCENVLIKSSDAAISDETLKSVDDVTAHATKSSPLDGTMESSADDIRSVEDEMSADAKSAECSTMSGKSSDRKSVVARMGRSADHKPAEEVKSAEATSAEDVVSSEDESIQSEASGLQAELPPGFGLQLRKVLLTTYACDECTRPLTIRKRDQQTSVSSLAKVRFGCDHCDFCLLTSEVAGRFQPHSEASCATKGG